MGKCISSLKQKKLNSSNTYVSDNLEDSIPEIASAVVSVKHPGGQSKLLIIESLRIHYLFRGLSTEDMEIMFSKLKFYSVPANSFIFEQGSKGKKFYIVEKGSLEVIRNGVKKAVLEPGKTFGEMALLTSATRSASIKTTEASGLWGIGREQFMAAVKVINKKNFSQNKEFLSNLKVFSALTEEQLIQLTESMVQHDYPENHRIICEGDEGLIMFVIKEGNCVAKIGGMEKYRIEHGGLFGEAVVIGDNKIRNTSVYSIGPVSVLSISRDIIIAIMGENFKETIYKTQAKNSLDTDYFTRMLGKSIHQEILEKMTWNSVKCGEIALTKESISENIYILCLGSLKGKDLTYSNFEVLGFKMKKLKHQEHLIAENEVILGKLSKEELKSIYKAPWDRLVYDIKVMMLLTKVHMLANMNLNSLRYIASHSYLQEFDAKEMIYRYNDEAYTMFLIKKGTVEISYNGKILRVMGKYDMFGDKCLDEPIRTNNARALSSCVCVAINSADVHDLIDESTKKVLKRKTTFLGTFSLNQIFMIKQLRQTDSKFYFYGKIENPEVYTTVTVIRKSYFDEVEKFNKLVQEKNILMKMEGHHIIKLLKTFSDQKFVYLVYEHKETTSLASVLNNRKVNEDFVKFIAASLTMVLISCHDKDILLRGISTNSIRIEQNGYPVICDLSTAKIIKGRTYSVVGDPLYIAPEVANPRGYSKSSDLWSLGILIYYMLYNNYPFDIKAGDDPTIIYDKTLKSPLKFPTDTKFIRGNEVISGLLKINPKERLQLQKLRFSRWLDSIDWESLANLKLVSPLKPEPFKSTHNNKSAKSTSLARHMHVKTI